MKERKKERKKKITKLKLSQNITYPGVRRMVETTKYAEVTKKYPNNQKIKLLCVWNKCNHKTRGDCPTCKWNESADPGDENHHRKTLQRPKHQSCHKQSQTGRAQGSSFLRWLLLLGHCRPYLKGQLKDNPKSLTGRHSTKLGKKIDPAQEWELPQERTVLSPWKWKLPFAKLGTYR